MHMNRKNLFIAITLLLPIYTHTATHYEPIAINGIGVFDGTGIISIRGIVEFQSKLNALLTYVFKTKPHESTWEQLIQMREQEILSREMENKLVDMITAKFLQISRNYLAEIRHLKPILVKLISIWAEQRNRTDSLAMLWAHIETGKEEQFAREYTPTLKTFYTFLSDIDMLLQDVIHSCPKSYARYLEAEKTIKEKYQHAAQN